MERPNGTAKYGRVPERILDKLTSLGVDVFDVGSARIPPLMWRFLVADDMDVTRFIVRDADSRLSERDSAAVAAWMRTDAAVHCIRDHPAHSAHPMLGGMWGGRPRQLAGVLWTPWKDLMKGYKDDYAMDMYLLGKTIWPKIQRHVYCHDSVSCDDWPNTHPFPVPRVGTEHVGQVFDAHGIPRMKDVDVMANTPVAEECTVQIHDNSTTTTSPPAIDRKKDVVDDGSNIHRSDENFNQHNTKLKPTTTHDYTPSITMHGSVNSVGELRRNNTPS